MKPASNTYKCGSKRKKHQCGIGLCSKFDEGHDEEEEIGNDTIKRQKFTKAAEDIKNVFLGKRLCKSCGRTIQGHPLPRGRNCRLIPLPNIKDVLIQKENVQLAKNRERQKSEAAKTKARERNKTEDAKTKARERNKTEDAKAKARERNKAEEAKAKARERNKSDDAKAKAKERNRSQEAKAKAKTRSAAARKRLRNSKSFIGWTNYEDFFVSKNELTNLTEKCIDCGAHMFSWEKYKEKNGGKTFSLCCSYGAIKLTPFRDPSPKLKKLFERASVQSRQFLDNIRRYNGLVSMSSKNITGKMTDFSKCKTRGPNIFKMSGQMYHLIPNVLPVQGKKSKFSQIFVYDKESQEEEVDDRIDHLRPNERKTVKRDTLKLIQAELKNTSPYVKEFKAAARIFQDNPDKRLKMVIKAKGSVAAKKRKQNPNVEDVIVVAPGEQTESRDVVLYRSQAEHPSKNDTVHIDENHYMYDPTAYPLVLPFGDDGYSIDHIYEKRKLTALEFYRYHIQVRDGFNTLLKSKRLYQEWLCDMWSKIEGSRLKFIKNNQDQLRVDQYTGLQDALAEVRGKQKDTEIPEEVKVGQMIILPASFTSSPRYMYSHYLDALAIAREFRKFTLFITMTGNPQWSTVQCNLFEGQKAYDRPDIMNRVFNKMLQDLMTDLKFGVLGPVKAWLYTIEGQLRCLKHAHILILLSIQLDVEDIDNIISAQIPDPEEKPELYECVSKYMLHGPCGPGYPNSPCMEKGVCSKGYPKDFQEETKLPHDGHGYPIYARPKNERIIEKDGFVYDNRWVVPYNEFILIKYDCHVNTEFIGSFTTIKYVYKYVHKGFDVSTVGVEEINDKDEVTRFINARTIDPYDSHWRMSQYRIQERFPAVQKLAIHTEGQHTVIFKEGKAAQALEEVKDSTLMAFFKLNIEDEDARKYKYQDIPKYYTWKDNKWQKKEISARR